MTSQPNNDVCPAVWRPSNKERIWCVECKTLKLAIPSSASLVGTSSCVATAEFRSEDLAATSSLCNSKPRASACGLVLKKTHQDGQKNTAWQPMTGLSFFQRIQCHPMPYSFQTSILFRDFSDFHHDLCCFLTSRRDGFWNFQTLNVLSEKNAKSPKVLAALVEHFCQRWRAVAKPCH